MKLPNSPEYQVTVLTAPEASWHERYIPFEVTVCQSGDPTEWYILEGIHEGKHVDSACCSKPVRKELVA